ncbi:uncharacterized protein LOC115766306 [Drosophila novamexicana]|uniref:uncharacterized protein LOC115766306 n=1 Tax=Drosophila novamexicana TaxID=47314 RepID=UPI0011E5F111|nr:uncharacterized protein LOC115766306 [Drosophila novamexicana]
MRAGNQKRREICIFTECGADVAVAAANLQKLRLTPPRHDSHRPGPSQAPPPTVNHLHKRFVSILTLIIRNNAPRIIMIFYNFSFSRLSCFNCRQTTADLTWNFCGPSQPQDLAIQNNGRGRHMCRG